MTTLADWTYTWLQARDLPTGIDRRGVVYAPVERHADGRVARELRVSTSSSPDPLVVFSVHSGDRIAATHAPQVHAACNRWNAGRRLGRAWVTEDESTLGVVVGAALPVDAATAEAVQRTGDAVIGSAVGFWRWADLNAGW